MARYKDADWSFPSPRVENWEQVGVAVLMDIRDELKALNSLLRCPNFLSIPAELMNIHTELRQIRRNTTRKRRKPQLKAVA